MSSLGDGTPCQRPGRWPGLQVCKRGEEAAPFDCVQADLRVTSDHSVGIIGGMGHDSQNLAFQ